MQYTVIINNVSYDLPKYDLGMKKKIDNINAQTSNQNIKIEERVRVTFDFVKELLGEENMQEVLDGDKVDNVDLSALNIAYNSICNAYDKPMDEYNMNRMEDKINTRMLDKVNQLTKTMQAVQDIPPSKR